MIGEIQKSGNLAGNIIYNNNYRKDVIMERFKICCAVHLFIIQDGKILLQRRNNPNKHGYLKLGVPAGHLEQGENVNQAMIREAKEELDIELTDFELVQIMNLGGDTDVYDAYFYLCKDYIGEIKNMESENAKTLEWHDISQPIPDLMEYEQHALKIYLENPNKFFTLFGWEK